MSSRSAIQIRAEDSAAAIHLAEEIAQTEAKLRNERERGASLVHRLTTLRAREKQLTSSLQRTQAEAVERLRGMKEGIKKGSEQIRLFAEMNELQMSRIENADSSDVASSTQELPQSTNGQLLGALNVRSANATPRPPWRPGKHAPGGLLGPTELLIADKPIEPRPRLSTSSSQTSLRSCSSPARRLSAADDSWPVSSSSPSHQFCAAVETHCARPSQPIFVAATAQPSDARAWSRKFGTSYARKRSSLTASDPQKL